MIEAGKTKEEAVKFAKQASIENPNCYVTLYSCLGFSQTFTRDLTCLLQLILCLESTG